MFEDKLRKMSRDVFNDVSLQEYFVLTHKKHRREMYFNVDNPSALFFAKPKFNSGKKKVVFFLLEMGVLQLFLKKMELSKKFGDVIFLGGQIKSIDLKNKIVNSFYHVQKTRNEFIEDKKDQMKLGETGFAPKIIELDQKNFFSREELFSPYTGESAHVFNRLLEFYEGNKEDSIAGDLLIERVSADLEKNGLNYGLFKRALNELPKVNYFLQSKIHGDFAKEQCLIKNRKIFFVDWSLRKGLVTEDLVNYFRLDDKYFGRRDFRLIITKYPNHVKENLKEYLLATELIRVCQRGGNLSLSKSRIRNILSSSF